MSTFLTSIEKNGQYIIATKMSVSCKWAIIEKVNNIFRFVFSHKTSSKCLSKNAQFVKI